MSMSCWWRWDAHQFKIIPVLHKKVSEPSADVVSFKKIIYFLHKMGSREMQSTLIFRIFFGSFR